MEEKESKRVKRKKEEIEIPEKEVIEVVVEKKSGFNYLEVIVIMIITLLLGSVIGSFITYMVKDKELIDQPVIKEVPSELKEFVKTYNNIINDYYEEVDHDKLLEAGIEGMLEYLGDDYSFYMNEDESENFNQQVEGKYTGIGVEITQLQDETVKISRVFDNSPASKAGLKAGDIFLSVAGEDISKLSASEISKKIKEAKSPFEIVVKRDEEELKFNLVLEQIDIESVACKIFENNSKKIGYIQLSVFAANTYTQFENKLLELEGKKIDGLIIDVRDNSGGYLSTVTDIASLFLSKNKVIYQLDTKGVVEQIYSTSNLNRKYPISVIINKNSASASEILASALQESYGATIVGNNSFGKGTVQKAYQLESGATVKYTIQKWLTPNGNWINEVGITPDIKVSLDTNYYANPIDDNDAQLQAAIKELSK